MYIKRNKKAVSNRHFKCPILNYLGIDNTQQDNQRKHSHVKYYQDCKPTTFLLSLLPIRTSQLDYNITHSMQGAEIPPQEISYNSLPLD